MRRSILWLHTHLGCFLAVYLLIYGLSTLLFNHEISFPETITAEWEATVNLTPGEPLSQARQAQVALDLVGDMVARKVALEAGTLRFRVWQVGGRYDVTVSPEGRASVVKREGGPVGVLKSLHGVGDPAHGPLWLRWRWYTLLSALGLATLGVTGTLTVLLDARSRRRLLPVAVISGISSLALMIWICLP